MANAKKCDVCGDFFTPNKPDRTQLIGTVGAHDIDIRFKPTLDLEDDGLYHSEIDVCPKCIKALLLDIINKIN